MTIPTKRPSPALYLAQAPNADERPRGPETVWQANAREFASTQETYAAQERNAGIREANKLRVKRPAEPGRAHYVLMRSFIRQARVLGLGYRAIPGMPYEAGGPVS